MTNLRSIFFLLFIAFTFVLAATEGDVMIGDYGHGYTSQKGDVVWSIRKEGNSLVFFSHGLNESEVSQIASKE